MNGWLRLFRSELRKLTTTPMPWAFLTVLAVIAGVNTVAVIYGTDMDGSKTFISTTDDQRSLVAFAGNAMMLAGLLGAIAVAREYGHGTVVPTFLASPRRYRAVCAQLSAVAAAGAALGLAGAGLTTAAVALAVPTTDYGFLLPADAVFAVLAASAFAGACGAVLGAGIGALVRNTGGAVTGAVVVLIIVPPLLAQLANEAGRWVPATLAGVLSGVNHDVGRPAAALALAAWGAVPALVGLVSVERRDVV